MLAPKYSLYICLSQKGTSLFQSRIYANTYPSGRIYKNKNRDSDTKGIPKASKIIL